jgi:hypothetical protein
MPTTPSFFINVCLDQTDLLYWGLSCYSANLFLLSKSLQPLHGQKLCSFLSDLCASQYVVPFGMASIAVVSETERPRPSSLIRWHVRTRSFVTCEVPVDGRLFVDVDRGRTFGGPPRIVRGYGVQFVGQKTETSPLIQINLFDRNIFGSALPTALLSTNVREKKNHTLVY